MRRRVSLILLPVLALCVGAPAPAGADAARDNGRPAVYDLDVSSPICGVYRDGKWHRPLDPEESGRPEAIARARSEGEDYLRREALKLALSQLGFSLKAEDRPPSCSVPYGQEIRTPQREKDPLDLLVERLSFPRLMEVLSQETVARSRDVLLYRRIRIRLDVLKEQMEAEGYTTALSSLRVRFVRGSRLEERAFLDAVHSRFPYLSRYEAQAPRGGKTECLLFFHAPVAKAVEKLNDMDTGVMKFSIELLPGNVAEVALWR